MKHNVEPLTVRIPRAIEMTGIGRSKIYELIQSGDLDVVKVGRCTLIPLASLKRLVEASTTAAP
jgi:excisionase family DNA binding protein